MEGWRGEGGMEGRRDGGEKEGWRIGGGMEGRGGGDATYTLLHVA